MGTTRRGLQLGAKPAPEGASRPDGGSVYTISLYELPDGLIRVCGSQWNRAQRYPVDVFTVEAHRDDPFMTRAAALEVAARMALAALEQLQDPI